MISHVEKYLSITPCKLSIMGYPPELSTILCSLLCSDKTNNSELDNGRYLDPFHLGLEIVKGW